MSESTQNKNGQPLRELNTGTGAVGSWLFKVVHSDIVDYAYSWQGAQVSKQKLRVMFVSPLAEDYCIGVMKETKQGGQKELEAAKLNMYKVHNLFRSKSICFTDDKKQYVSTPFKLVLDLRKCKLTSLLQSQIPMPMAAQPPGSIIDIVGLQLQSGGVHRFDITALCSVSAVRYSQTRAGLRCIVDVTLIDGSTTAVGKKAELSFALFVACKEVSKPPPDMEAFLSVVESDDPISFFALNAKRPSGGAMEITTSSEFFWIAANGTKAECLKSRSSELKSLKDEDKTKLTTAWEPSSTRDYEAEQCSQTTCALLDACGGQNAHLAHDKVFQLNFTEVQPPSSADEILTKDGSRLWMRVQVADFTGKIEVGLREKAALQLAGLDHTDPASKETFKALHAADDLRFPMLSSIRVILTCKQKAKPDGTEASFQLSQADEPTDVFMTIVIAEEQNLEAKPKKSMLELLEFMKVLEPRTDGIVPAMLSSIQPSAHYPMAIKQLASLPVGASEPGMSELQSSDTSSLAKPCDKALVMVFSTNPSKQEKLREGAYRLETNQVKCALDADDSETYTITAMCSETSLRQFDLTAPRSGNKRQAALLVLTSVAAPVASESKSFACQSMHLLTNDEVPLALSLMKGLLYVADRNINEGTCKRPEWQSSESSPVERLSKCRKLGYCPTDASLPDE